MKCFEVHVVDWATTRLFESGVAQSTRLSKARDEKTIHVKEYFKSVSYDVTMLVSLLKSTQKHVFAPFVTPFCNADEA